MGYISPTNHDDPDSAYSFETSVYDENLGTHTTNGSSDEYSGHWLELNHAAFICVGFRFYVYSTSYTRKFKCEFYYDGAWHLVYQNDYIDGINNDWIEVTGLTPRLIEKARIDFASNFPGNTSICREFDFQAQEPTCTTKPATEILPIQAVLNGLLDDDAGEACDCGFEWGETDAYGQTTPTASRTTGQTFSQKITGLKSSTTYHFRAFATNAAGTGYGEDMTFITGLPPLDPTIAPKKVSLELIRNLEIMNNGRFYISKLGNAIYESRFHR